MNLKLTISIGLLVLSMMIGLNESGILDREAQPSITVSALDKDDIESTLRSRMQEVGPVQAREELKVLYESDSVTDIHNAGHLLGRVLFKEFDKEGIAYCDAGFTFGCYHEFFARVIHRDGIGIVPELNEICFSSQRRLADAFACQHGIGHGLQVHGGYEIGALHDALAACHTLTPLDPINGCYGGAVMEYNMKTMLSAHQIPPREYVNEQGHMFPCTEIEEYATQACYYWQSQWWLFALQLEVAEVGRLCREVSSNVDRSACFFGIGNRIPDLTASAFEAIHLCEVFADGTGDENHLDCLASTAVTYSESGQVEQAKAVCASLHASPDAFAFCDRIRKNEG